MEADFGMTISLNAPKFTIDIEPGYSLPVYEDPLYPGVKGFLVIFSLNYMIF